MQDEHVVVGSNPTSSPNNGGISSMVERVKFLKKMCLVLVYRGEKKSSNEAHNLISEGALPSSARAHAKASTLARLDYNQFCPKISPFSVIERTS